MIEAVLSFIHEYAIAIMVISWVIAHFYGWHRLRTGHSFTAKSLGMDKYGFEHVTPYCILCKPSIDVPECPEASRECKVAIINLRTGQFTCETHGQFRTLNGDSYAE